jgi:hypothetical protein
MALLNYTTTIDVEKTHGEICRLLAKHGAKSVLSEFDKSGDPSAVSFLIDTPFGERGFRLPANIDAVFQTLTKQWGKGQVQRRFVTHEQAARVGWRIVKDWLEAQMAIVETQMVTFTQVMLPYMVTDQGQTVYEALESRNLALPSGRTVQAVDE